MIITPLKNLQHSNISFSSLKEKPCAKKDIYENLQSDRSYKDGLSDECLKSYPLQYYVSKSSSEDRLNGECFLIKMKHYGKNSIWANKMVKLTKNVSKSIQNKENFSKVLDLIEYGVMEINDNCFYGQKRKSGSYYQTAPFILTSKSRGEEYFEKYNKKVKRIFCATDKGLLKSGVNCSHIEKTQTGSYLIYYPSAQNGKSSNLAIVSSLYEDLILKENPTKKEVIETAAKIQWLIAQETPYIRGSDSIANILTKAIMHAYHVPISPLKEGISLDFEAFYLDLDEYIKNYPTFFEINPLKGED